MGFQQFFWLYNIDLANFSEPPSHDIVEGWAVGVRKREHNQRDCIFLPYSSLLNITQKFPGVLEARFWKKNQPMSAKSPILSVQVSRMIILLAVPPFSQLFLKWQMC